MGRGLLYTQNVNRRGNRRDMNKAVENGEKFLRECLFDGLAHSYDIESGTYVKPYPEVTGYLLSYFCENYNTVDEQIIEATDKLLELQDPHVGGYATFYDKNTLFSFDTSQILIGLINVYKITNERKYYDAALFAGEFLLMMQCDNGAIIPTYSVKRRERYINDSQYEIWNGSWSGLMCKLTEGFDALYSVSNDERFLIAKNKAADFYAKSEYIECSHPLGYWLEGLYAGGKHEIVDKILREKVIPRIQSNGYISYADKYDFAYVSGTIQLGIMLYKMGYIEMAQKICEYGEEVQRHHESGGLFQYANSDGSVNCSIHGEQNSWGTKYFCQLERLIGE